MLALIMVALIGGLVVGSYITSTIGLIAGIVLFICGLPFAIIRDIVHSEVSYAQDRADYRQVMADIEAERREDERLLFEDIMRSDDIDDADYY